MVGSLSMICHLSYLTNSTKSYLQVLRSKVISVDLKQYHHKKKKKKITPTNITNVVLVRTVLLLCIFHCGIFPLTLASLLLSVSLLITALLCSVSTVVPLCCVVFSIVLCAVLGLLVCVVLYVTYASLSLSLSLFLSLSLSLSTLYTLTLTLTLSL